MSRRIKNQGDYGRCVAWECHEHELVRERLAFPSKPHLNRKKANLDDIGHRKALRTLCRALLDNFANVCARQR